MHHVALKTGLPEAVRVGRVPRSISPAKMKAMHGHLRFAGDERAVWAAANNIVNPEGEWAEEALAQAKAAREIEMITEHVRAVKAVLARCQRVAPQLQRRIPAHRSAPTLLRDPLARLQHRQPPSVPHAHAPPWAEHPSLPDRRMWHERLHGAQTVSSSRWAEVVTRAPPRMPPRPHMRFSLEASRRTQMTRTVSAPTMRSKRPDLSTGGPTPDEWNAEALIGRRMHAAPPSH